MVNKAQIKNLEVKAKKVDLGNGSVEVKGTIIQL